MNRFLNTRETIVTEAIDGLLSSSSGKHLARLDGFPHIKVVVRKDSDRNKVAVVSGGGSGAGGGATDGGGGDAGTGGDGGSVNYTISVRINGNGGVRAEALGLDCRTACDAPGQAGTHVLFVPVADSGWTFDGWGELCSGNIAYSTVPSGPAAIISRIRFAAAMSETGRG